MSLKKLVISEEILQTTLTQYEGVPLENEKINDYHRIGFGIFANPTFVFDPRIQFTSQLDITEIYENYKRNYKVSAQITFATFVKWIVLKAMLYTPFTWREINGQWFDFANLPLIVTMRMKNNRTLALYALENVCRSTWSEFCRLNDSYKAGKLQDLIHVVHPLPFRTIGYEILNLHIPRMTSYNVTTRTTYAHRPFIVISDRYEQDKKLYLPFYVNYSHATLTPEDAEFFLSQFQKYAKMLPEEVEKAAKFVR